MKKKDWENAANSLNAISSEMSEYPAIQKTIAKLKKQLDKN